MRKMLGLPSSGKGMHGYAVYLLLLSFLLVFSNVVQAQESGILRQRITYHANKQPLLKVLKDVRALTKVRFTFNNDEIRKQEAVTVNLQNGTLEQLLNQVLSNTGLEFTEDMGGIAIYPKSAPAGLTTTQETKSIMGFVFRGQVISSGGEPLQGVTIQGMESKNGTVTTEDGIFSIVLKENEQLRVSRLGMKTKVFTPRVNNNNFSKIELDSATQSISEVVVNGYTKIDARLSAASTFKLDAAQLIQPGEPTIDRMLQGKVPGLMVMNSTGSVNGRPTLRIRGTSTFVGNASPLWVIDNVVRPDPVDMSATQLNNVVSDAQTGNYALIGSAVSGLNPYDVESITFLKDAAATAIYGVAAANGVIVVTTKKGKAGPMQVSYNTNLSFQQRPSYVGMKLMNSKERLQFSREMVEDGMLYNVTSKGFAGMGTYEGLLQALNARQITEPQFKTEVARLEANNTDWFKVLFRNSFSMNHSINMSGGMGKSTYYASFGYSDDRGASQMDTRKNYTVSTNLHTEATKRLSFDIHIMGNYSKMGGYYPGVNPLGYALTTSRTLSPETIYPKGSSGTSVMPLPPPLTFNMLNEIAQTESSGSTRSMGATFTASYKLLPGLLFQSTSAVFSDASDVFSAAYEGSFLMGMNRGWNLSYTPSDRQVAASYLPYGGIATIGNTNSLSLTTRNMFIYDKSFFQERDQFNFSFGNEISSQQAKGFNSTEPGYYPDRGQAFYPAPKSIAMYSRRSITNTVNNAFGLFATASYVINSRYVLNANIRTDGNNRFGQYSNSKFLPNYSVAARWNVTNESWLPSGKLLNNLVFRASLGTAGNVVKVVGPELIAEYPIGGNTDPTTGIPQLGIKSLPYPDLRWEKTQQWNFGADVGLFENRVSFTVEYYIKHSRDLLVPRNIPFEYGIDMMYKNGGAIQNRGMDLFLSIVPIRTKWSNLTLTFNNSRNFNAIGENSFANKYDDYLNGDVRIPGKPISGFYSFHFGGLDPKTGLPLFSRTGHPDGVDTAGLLVYSGQLHPKFSGGMGLSYRYKQFSVQADLAYAWGNAKRLNPLFNNQNIASDGVPAPYDNANRILIDRWRKPGDEKTTNIPAVTDVAAISVPGTGNRGIYDAYNQSDIRVVDGSFIRCKNIMFSYAIPRSIVSMARVKSISAGLFISNLFTLASKDLHGEDPEVQGVGSTALPITRKYGFSMNVNF
ncbi:MAG: SusC/RagA family TonB-linked outer membrane protein [Chitinophaga sp.]|uniref:SusC/RagA family TonB-linked outer membrane protein n=1 Tax=Chitinophaga sp. TaxID=1869181 RepID=UPI001B1275B1|nr:SusC/RagA family TonB-linked outer membrane protein [Chitinophaga sp.]MBO9731571.1 SusC/RagA family TonB-linked outer membrane protein [Chitinophaga sp.]